MNRGTLKYLVKGVRPDRESRQDLHRELTDNLPNASSIVILPVVQGYSLEIEMADLAPFTSVSFEPYLSEHVLPEAVAIRCETLGPVQLELLKARYY